MKRILSIVVLIICFGQSSCERDDICAEATPTTPLLVIDFFDANNPSEEKIPANLAIIEEGEEDLTKIRTFNESLIQIPLRTDVDQTVYRMVLNSTASEDSEDQPNIDVLTFNYSRTEEFVSKACGFRVTYDDLLPINNEPLDDGSWIQSIDILTSTIVNDTITHVRIFH